MSDPIQEPIAIVGMACLFPRSPDLATYWRNIVHAVDCISEVPDDHSWRPEEHFDADPKARDKTYSRRGGFLDKVPFDPLQFGIAPNALDATDSTQLLGLIVAREALRDAGVDPDGAGWNRDRTGVVLGVSGTQELAVTLGARLYGPTWKRAMLRCGVDAAVADAIVDDISNHFPEWQEQSFPGLLGNVIAGRIANRLDLGGSNCVVDAACASSLAAVQLAASDLRSGRADLVLSGGADTLNDIFMYMCFSKTPALSSSDDARPFDEAADGILISEGLAVLALKRLSDAERDEDRVYAVIRGIGSSSDGKGTAIYAPNPAGQLKAITRAHDAAGVTPDTIELLEAHGTGTKAGDVAEVTALKQVFAGVKRPGRFVALGSVKSQIGHTKSTAGAAGMMKVALALHQRILPPTAKVERPNPKMEIEQSPLYLNTRARPWVRAGDFPRRAGVSAFGFGGSNFHAILEEHGDADAVAPRFTAEAELVLLGAPDAAELRDRVATAREALAEAPTLQHAVRPLLEAWRPAEHVVGFLATSLDDLAEKLAIAEALVDAGPGARDGVTYGVPTGDTRRAALLFPGQGSQYVEMGRTVALRHAAVRAALDRADEAFRQAGRQALSARIFPPPAFDDATRAAQETELTATEWAQPAIGALSKGLLDALRRFGVDGEAFAGHSYGELVALHAAGVIDEDALWEASRVRGEAMADRGTERGTMAAVSGPLDRIEAVLGEAGGDAVLANLNHPSQGVISGTAEAVRTTMEALQEAGLAAKALRVSAAFHSPLVADACAPFTAALQALPFQPPARPVYSTVTAAPYPDDPAEMHALLGAQITSPVDWVGVIEALWGSGVRTFVECGPGRVLTGLLRHTLKGREGWSAVALDGQRAEVDGDVQLKQALVVLAARGLPVDVAPLLAEPLPPAPRRAGSRATVWVGGANLRTERTKNPPLPERVRERPAPAQATARPTPLEPRPATAAPFALPDGEPTVAHHDDPLVDASALAALLQTTRQSLAAFQEAQERTARVHSQFLEAQAQANAGFHRLFETHARLVELAATGHLPERLPEPAGAPAPVAASPGGLAPSVERMVDFLSGSENPKPSDWPTLGRPEQHLLPALDATRPAIATDDDLPPLMTADRAGGALEPVELGAAVAPPTPAAIGATQDALVAATLNAVAEKTGYPADMLDLAMDLEGDLGVDSIKRVEIFAAIQERVPGLPDLDNETLAALRTLRDVVDRLQAAAPAASPAPAGPSREALVAAILSAVAEKTGYPADMLDLAMDLEGDLGVDSIKRVEIFAAVQERVPRLPDLDNETLAALRTLRDVVDHLDTLRPTASAVAAAPALSREALVAATLGAVAEKTGYPADMLDLAMELEGDLGVDSIKRVEILAAVQERVPGLPDLDNETLSALRTLRDVVEQLAGLSLGAAAAPAVAPVAAAPAPPAPPVRRVVQVVAAPPGIPFASGSTVVVGDGAGLGPALVEALRARGVEARGEPVGWIPSNGGTPASIVHVAAVGARGATLHEALLDAFHLARSTRPTGLFATVTGQGGRFGRDGSADPMAAGLPGLVKTLGQEWEATRVLALDVDPESIDARAIASEVLTDRGVVEVGLLAGGAPITLAVVPTEQGGEADVPLEAGDLVVVSGGARGVTAAVVVETARRWRPSLLLLGRSALADEPAWAAGVADGQLQAARLAAAKAGGERLLPRDLDRDLGRVRAGREVRRTLAAVQEAGGRALYRAADVRDPAAVARAVAEAVASFGPVRGLVHGAGVLADKLVEEKTDAQFDQVFGTKVDGWRALLAATDPSDLRFAAVFSSVAGRYGNLGQCDYAAANEVLVHEALALAARGVRAKAFDWGPWEAGMVTPALKKALQARGMALIPLSEGAAFFCDEIERGGPAVEVVVGGPDHGGALLADGRSVVHVLRGEADRFLRDHQIGGKPVLPAVMVLEWMARAARQAHPELHVLGIRDFVVLKGVVVEDERTEVRLRWQDAPPRAPGQRALAFELLGARGRMGPTVHYRGVVDLAEKRLDPPWFPGTNGLGRETWPYSVQEAYDRFLFTGPGLHGIEAIAGFSDHGIVATLRTSAPNDLGVAGERWETDPVTLDSLLQCVVLWVRETQGNAALPAAVGSYRQFGPLNGPITCHLEVQPAGRHHGRFRADLVDARGTVVATLEEGAYTSAALLNAKFERASA